MVRSLIRWFCLIIAITEVQAGTTTKVEDLSIPISVYKERRERLMQELGAGSVAIFYSNPEHNRNNDINYKYRQDDNLYYLTGIDEPNVILVLIPSGYRVQSERDSVTQVTREILFHEASDTDQNTSSVQVLMSSKNFYKTISLILKQVQALYLPAFPEDFSGEIAKTLEPIRENLRSICRSVQLKEPTPLVSAMRVVKSSEEITLIRHSTEISSRAHMQAMMSAEPGMYGYEIQAVLEYVFAKQGSSSPAFPTRINVGKNSLISTPVDNKHILEDGDLLIVEAGAEYCNYASDITRTYPSNGRFTDAQREIYELALQAQEEAIKAVRPGLRYCGYEPDMMKTINRGLVQLGILHGDVDSLYIAGAYKRFTSNGTCQTVGLWVHDIEPSSKKYETGMVVAIEAGISIPKGADGVDPKYFDIDVCIKDMILITKDGVEILSSSVPKSVQEIERLMRKRGIGNEPLD